MTSPTPPLSPSIDPVPFHRRSTFHTPPTSSSSAQQSRRARALEAQSERRQHAFMAARSGLNASTLGGMDDLNLSNSMDSSSDTSEPEDQFADATATEPGISQTKRKAYKPRYYAWAKNLLQYAETLNLEDGLPDNLEKEWGVVVVPVGKRCLCSTQGLITETNTTLLSRVAGRTLTRRRSVLPPDSLLDCIWDEEENVIWVLDIVRWKSVWYVEHDVHFRAFFLDSKLSELPLQPYSPSPSLSTLILPIPLKLPPLTCPSLLSVISKLSQPSSLPIPVLLSTPAQPMPSREVIQIPFKPTGLLFYLLEARYESGQTALSGWVPIDVEIGRESKEGIARMRELLVAKEAGEGMSVDEMADGDEMEN